MKKFSIAAVVVLFVACSIVAYRADTRSQSVGSTTVAEKPTHNTFSVVFHKAIGRKPECVLCGRPLLEVVIDGRYEHVCHICETSKFDAAISSKSP